MGSDFMMLVVTFFRFDESPSDRVIVVNGSYMKEYEGSNAVTATLRLGGNKRGLFLAEGVTLTFHTQVL